MGNKRKTRERREERSIANREAYSRMNFLYQASQEVLMENPENLELSRFYAFTMKSIGQKLLCKIDPSIKRTICKYCHSVLIPGLTSTVRVKAKREKHLVVRCLDCGTLKRFHTHKDYKLWSEQQPDETQEQAQGQCFRPEQKQKQIEAQMQIPKDRTRHRDQQQANVLDQNKIEAQLQIPQEALATDRTRHRDQQQANVLDLGNKIEAQLQIPEEASATDRTGCREQQ